ncbi:hypothetical protein Cgig2_001053 [Carnegiea gigantea]|uniref:Uncharacterized protein n=1 Tax=Carnegiea gigantea TaxID=171969 RepID=A0A9Q1JQE9_9CARY|nr:hypothetical protein Cgig2_001053 [Carnegiea gigantea]
MELVLPGEPIQNPDHKLEYYPFPPIGYLCSGAYKTVDRFHRPQHIHKDNDQNAYQDVDLEGKHWPGDVRLDHEIMVHKLSINHQAKLVKQKREHFAHDRNQIIKALRWKTEDVKGTWVDKLTRILWSLTTTVKLSTNHMPLMLTYGAEAQYMSKLVKLRQEQRGMK